MLERAALHRHAEFGRLPCVVPEAKLERTENGLVARSDGWFVLNAREAAWRHVEGRSAVCDFEGESSFDQTGVNVSVLQPGEFMGMYHWEINQEDFLVLHGEATLIVEGQERPLHQWDFVHCPPETKHIIVGAGDGPCVVLAIGARDRGSEENWGGYTVDETAQRYGVSVDRETTNASEAYARFPQRQPTLYREGWLPP